MSHLINKTLWEIISQNTSDTESEWLTEKGNASPIELMTAFVSSPRFLSKKIVNVEVEEEKTLN